MALPAGEDLRASRSAATRLARVRVVASARPRFSSPTGQAPSWRRTVWPAPLLEMPSTHVVRKPLTSFLREGDRDLLHQLLRQMPEHAEQLLVRLHPRHSLAIEATLAGVTDSTALEGSPRYRWVVVPTSAHDQGAEPDGPDATATAFAELCRLAVEEDADGETPGACWHGSPRSVGPRCRTRSASACLSARPWSRRRWRPSRRSPRPSTTPSSKRGRALHRRLRDRPATALPAGGRRRRWPDFRQTWSAWAACWRSPCTLAVTRTACSTSTPLISTSSRPRRAHRRAVRGGRGSLRAGRTRPGVAASARAAAGGAALESRAVMDQAKGIIMARHGCTADEAFACVVTVSRNRNSKIRDLAAELVETARRRD